MKGLLRFGLVWLLSMLVTPYVDRFLSQLAERAPKDSLLEDVLEELNQQYSSSLIRSFGESIGELVFGAKKK